MTDPEAIKSELRACKCGREVNECEASHYEELRAMRNGGGDMATLAIRIRNLADYIRRGGREGWIH